MPALNTKGYSSTAPLLGTRPNISESHSEMTTQVPLCIVAGHVAPRVLVCTAFSDDYAVGHVCSAVNRAWARCRDPP